jgi:hypothetical protein
MTLDTEVDENQEIWETVFSEQWVEHGIDAETMMGRTDFPIYLYTWTSADGVESTFVSIDISLDYFQYHVKSMYATTNSLVEAKFRIAYRDSDGNIISTDSADLYDEFMIDIQ